MRLTEKHIRDSLNRSPHLVVVDKDVLGITDRIKEIDKEYFLVFNALDNRFEVHHADAKPYTRCLTLPYERLDARAIDYVNSTRVENAKQMIYEMDRHNEALEAQKKKELLNQMEELTDQAMPYFHKEDMNFI